MTEDICWNWYLERINKYETRLIGIEEPVASCKTRFQKVDILKTYQYGLCLFLDGKIQSSELDEATYHEALVQPGMFLHKRPSSALVIGGGEGATLREVLRHNTITKAVMVDIDEEVVDFCKKHLTKWHQGSYEDKRTRLFITDAYDFVQDTRETFDVIIFDATEPVEEGPAVELFSEEFYTLCKRRLKRNGIFSLQAGSFAVSDITCFASVYKTLSRVFKFVHPYQTYITSFATLWGFILASDTHKTPLISKERFAKIQSERNIPTLSFYNHNIHNSLFAIPNNYLELLERQGRIISKKRPISVYT